MCVNLNWQIPQSNYLLKYFYTSHFDHVPFVMFLSFIVFRFVLVYIYLLHISLFKEFKFIPVKKIVFYVLMWYICDFSQIALLVQCFSCESLFFFVFQPSTVEHLPYKSGHHKYVQTSCSTRLCSAVHHVYH